MTELRCIEVVELVTDFLDAALDAEHLRHLVAHLSGCEGCRRYVENIRQVLSLLGRQAVDLALPSETRASLMAALRPAGGAPTP